MQMQPYIFESSLFHLDAFSAHVFNTFFNQFKYSLVVSTNIFCVWYMHTFLEHLLINSNIHLWFQQIYFVFAILDKFQHQ
jgi:hypothetical protein